MNRIQPLTFFVSVAQASARGLRFEKVPEPEVCGFCGKKLPPKGFVQDGTVVRWFVPGCDCEGARVARERQRQAEIQALCDAERQACRRAKISSIIDASGVKKRFQRRTFANFDVGRKGQLAAFTEAKKYAARFAEALEEGDGLYFYGNNGTGKTYLAAAIALELLPKGVCVVFRTFDDLLRDIKETFDNEQSEKEVFKAYTEADLLIIDDLGKGRCTEWSTAMLFSIVNARYEDCKPIIVTANYSFDELVDELTPKGCSDGDALGVVSRLKGCCKPIPMFGDDMRIKRPDYGFEGSEDFPKIFRRGQNTDGLFSDEINEV